MPGRHLVLRVKEVEKEAGRDSSRHKGTRRCLRKVGRTDTLKKTCREMSVEGRRDRHCITSPVRDVTPDTAYVNKPRVRLARWSLQSLEHTGGQGVDVDGKAGGRGF
ncbi:hypothetical protein Pcinc_043205 [Petrolisthes cinctipes]|uniref:Uncharacterized protein n=1 Tax=Petrolisthes cinctipes TaxID=88211 RepID=A0AAE1EGF7_PETCI|nr:hypothetical protein Pcinc_043205 [Petrolisthes cinctipes]